LLYVGHAASWSEIIFQGSVAAGDFLAFYLKDDQILAVAGMNRDREMAAIEELMRADRMPSRTQLKDGFPDFLELLKGTGPPMSTAAYA
jgi:apoptosis-inducing factor 3